MIQVRKYGTGGNTVVMIHGGPGAPGYMAPLARRLSENFRIIEPLQRRSGHLPLSVATHVKDLKEILISSSDNGKPALVGHSWGAMLALAFAAENNDMISSIVLIGCGTFDKHSRERLLEIRDKRITCKIRKKLDKIDLEVTDPDKRLSAYGDIMTEIELFDPVSNSDDCLFFDSKGHHETWNDMLRLQENKVFPAAFNSIDAPTIMMHGDYDTHPGKLIRNSLINYIPQLEYKEWEECGHYPWLEKSARKKFESYLDKWLESNF